MQCDDTVIVRSQKLSANFSSVLVGEWIKNKRL